jgi:hypothetical protein
MSPIREEPYRLLRVSMVGIGLVAILSFFGAIGVSKLYWGYYVQRPSLDKRIREIERVISLTAIRSENQSDGTMRFVVNDTYSIADRLNGCRDEDPSYSYYCLSERVLVVLDDFGKLPALPDRMHSGELALLYDRLEATKLLRDGSPGYEHAKELVGIALEAEGKDGQRYLFVGVTGRQVSNDHYPFYEFLFHVPDRDSVPMLLSRNRFFYDVAGMEGAEWPVAFLAFLLLGTAILALTVVALSVIDTIKGRGSVRKVLTVALILVATVILIVAFSLVGWSVSGG